MGDGQAITYIKCFVRPTAIANENNLLCLFVFAADLGGGLEKVLNFRWLVGIGKGKRAKSSKKYA